MGPMFFRNVADLGDVVHPGAAVVTRLTPRRGHLLLTLSKAPSRHPA